MTNESLQKEKTATTPRTRGWIASLFSRIPHGFIIMAGNILGLFFYALDIRHRRIVKSNLQFAYPDWNASDIKKHSKKVFKNIAVTALEICQMTCFSSEDITNRVRIEGEEILLDSIKSSRGIILISAHLGNWEMGPLFISCYFQYYISSVARTLQSKILDGWITRLRTRFGNSVFTKKGAMTKMVRLMRDKGSLGILIDQGTTLAEGVEGTFFGKKVTATPAAALLARRYDSIVLPCCCVRNKDGMFTLIIKPPLVLEKTSDSRSDNIVNTQIMIDSIEDMIREFSDQWLWVHKRWKRHYPELYPEDMARRDRKRAKKRKHRKKTDGSLQ